MIDAVATEMADIVAPLPPFPRALPLQARPASSAIPRRRSTPGLLLAILMIAALAPLTWLIAHSALPAKRQLAAQQAPRPAVTQPAPRLAAAPLPPVTPALPAPAVTHDEPAAAPQALLVSAEQPVWSPSLAQAPRTARPAQKVVKSERTQHTLGHLRVARAQSWRQDQIADRDCGSSEYLAWCRRGEARQADQALRSAYGLAVQRGVDRTLLVHVRQDWGRLRTRALKDPDAMITGYGQLEDVLRRAIDEASS